MVKYIIQLYPNSYVKDAKNDTKDVKDAKRFPNFDKAVKFLRTFCGACSVVKVVI